MKSIIGALEAILFLQIPVALSEKWVGERNPDIVFYAEGIDVPVPVKYNGADIKSGAALKRRSLIESWLQPRQLTCVDPGWQLCTG